MKNLECPHGNKIVATNTLGIISYTHIDDGKGCTLLNRLDATPDAIAKSIIDIHGIKNIPEVKAVVSSSKLARRIVYEILSKEKGSFLSNKLKEYTEIITESQYSGSLLKELVFSFGKVVVDNIMMVSGYDLNSFFTNSVQPPYKMANLIRNDIDIVIGKASAKRQQTKAELLSEIIDGIV